MIYNFSLQSAGLVAGASLLLVSLACWLKPDGARALATRLPRSFPAGVALLTCALVWSFWLLATMEMGEFSSFRRPLLIFLPIGFALVLKLVNEFLAVRALGILFLLAAEPLLEAAFFRSQTTRLLVTVLAYLLIIAGLFWVAMPYLLRDQIKWSTGTSSRWRTLHGILFFYGAAILTCAIIWY